MASAAEQLYGGYTGDMSYVSSSPMTFEDYYHIHSGYGYNAGPGYASSIQNPNSFLSKVGNIFTGKVTNAKQGYENYLADFEYQRNKQQAAYETWLGQQREDTSFQRQVADIAATGFNPAIALVNGSLSNSPSSALETARYKRTSKTDGKSDDKILSTALKVLALILFKKA